MTARLRPMLALAAALVLVSAGCGGNDAYAPTVQQPGGQSPDFALTVSRSSILMPSRGTATVTVTLKSLNGFSSPVTMSADALQPSIPGAPADRAASRDTVPLSVAFDPKTVTPTAAGAVSTATIADPNSAAPSATPYTITIRATGGGKVHTAEVSVTVTTIDIAVTPASQDLHFGTSVDYSVTVTPRYGFTGTVDLGTIGLPQFVTPDFQPAPLSFAAGDGAKPSTLTLALGLTLQGAAARPRPPGRQSLQDVSFTVVGQSGPLRRTATAIVRVETGSEE